MTTRRDFLGSSLMAAAVAAMPGILNAATTAGSAVVTKASPKVLVDWHSHFVTRAEIRILSARKQAPRIITNQAEKSLLENVTTVSAIAGDPSEFEVSDIAARLKHLDDNGIARQLLTHTVALGLDSTLPLDEQRVLFRAINDELAEVIQKYPDRFFAVAALPSGDPHWAAQELTRAQRELGFIGGSLPLNAFSTLEGARTLAPLFATAQKLGSHFFIHRGPANAVVPGQPPLVVPADTNFARWSLISNSHLTAGGITLGLTDFLDPYPDVTVQVIMLAGFLPYLTDSFISGEQRSGIKDPLTRLRRIFLDPGPYSRNGEWVVMAANKIGADRILFGTDYGVGGGAKGDVAPAIATLDHALNDEQRRLIYIDNSRKLLRSKGRII
jgi:predicted TIM-barrel fold metal-dependent hydrolase